MAKSTHFDVSWPRSADRYRFLPLGEAIAKWHSIAPSVVAEMGWLPTVPCKFLAKRRPKAAVPSAARPEWQLKRGLQAPAILAKAHCCLPI